MSENGNLARLLSGNAFPGVGRATVSRLIDTHGDELYEILERQDVGALLRTVGARKADVIVQGWSIVRARREVARWLDKQGIDPGLGGSVYKAWPTETIERLEENPYRLLALMGWKAVDRLAKGLGIAWDHPVRLVGAAEAACYAWIDDRGSTWVPRIALEQDAAALLSGARDARAGSQTLARQAIEYAVETRALISVRDGYQVPGAYFAERLVERWLRERVDNAPSNDALREALRAAERRKEVELTPEQKEAAMNALRSRVSVFYGGAGVGKTTVVSSICEMAEARGKLPVLLALAAKAVRKLALSTGRESMTLARALYQRSSEDFRNTVVVIDEFSMVDLLGFRQLIKKLPEDAHLVLCGDAAQLPSIGPGRLLYSFIHAGSLPTQELTVTHRQAAETGIPEKLQSIRDGVWPNVPAFDWGAPEADGVYMLHCERKDDRTIRSIIARLLDVYEGEAQVISPLARYALGAKALNAHIHHHLTGGSEYTRGAPVVFTANQTLDSGQEVVNGLQGTIRRMLVAEPRLGSTPYLEVATDEDVLTVSLAEAETCLELAYALTVHRAQGSDWETVIAVLPPSRLLERAMVYTALSRCKRRCVVVVPKAGALRDAVAREPSYEQRTDGLFTADT
ncbi:AAA family ATPase [Spiribacter halobius]|uniref:AAA+ ATPase domain-containing protein n=1 Tax=Sediminicurvatus halobius TaxID=2182432 RepID=A0A2U2N4G5_9GAMM|nr:AAA family ATPase [Spiribacter halobius]PWG64121.1 hypothetical protein DEM34_06375 [Spiribacter halobius]UEX78759.1 ATP-dependent RecD-like DNA helicase [Spiribacter halobius]